MVARFVSIGAGVVVVLSTRILACGEPHALCQDEVGRNDCSDKPQAGITGKLRQSRSGIVTRVERLALQTRSALHSCLTPTPPSSLFVLIQQRRRLSYYSQKYHIYTTLTMATNALITFKAGKCDLRGKKVTPDATPGYLYLYVEDDIPHFCWRPRSAPPTEPEIDLFMVPGDGTFQPLLKEEGAEELHSPTNGRIYVLKFSSSSQRHFFWMQSKTQHKEGSLSWFSQRDQRVGQIVNDILQGDEDVDIEQAVQELRNGGGDGDGDGDLMDLDEQQPEPRDRTGSTGGAGADATGADPRDEGAASRDGGADGGRA